MNSHIQPCGCDPAYTSCKECNPPPCLGCGKVAPLNDDLCAGCHDTQAELDADLARAVAVHVKRQAPRAPVAFTGGLNSCPHGRRPDQDCGACEGPAFDEGRE